LTYMYVSGRKSAPAAPGAQSPVHFSSTAHVSEFYLARRTALQKHATYVGTVLIPGPHGLSGPFYFDFIEKCAHNLFSPRQEQEPPSRLSSARVVVGPAHDDPSDCGCVCGLAAVCWFTTKSQLPASREQRSGISSESRHTCRPCISGRPALPAVDSRGCQDQCWRYRHSSSLCCSREQPAGELCCCAGPRDPGHPSGAPRKAYM
jgi:hypothetical protein